MTRKILLVNGPNLNLLGVREPGVYGTDTLDDIVDLVTETADELGFGVHAVQSNHEGVLIDAIHAARTDCDAIVINPGASRTRQSRCATRSLVSLFRSQRST